MRMGICFCQPGVMSQCVATDVSEQRMCDYWNRSDTANRCMHVNESMDNHCWSPEAQYFGREHGVIRPTDDMNLLEEEEISLVAMVENNGRTCIDCILYTCSYVIREQQAAQPLGGLTAQDLINMAANCAEYDDEASMNARIAQSLRGNNP